MKKICLSFLLMAVCICMQAQKNFIDQPYIQVQGSADTLVTPDQIYIRVSLSEKDTRDRVPLEELESKLVAALKLAGINTETKLTINDESSNFRNYVLKGRDIIKSKQYNLKVKDAMTATKVFVQLEEAGISNASIERIGHSQSDWIKNLMRSQAMAHAKEKAFALTKPLNQVAGPAIHIEDQDMTSTDQARLARSPDMMFNQYKKGADLPKIEFEKIRISSVVSVRFVLK